MSVNEDHVRVQHMLDAALKTQVFLKDMTRQDFDSNEMLQLAQVRLIEIIAEAAARISDDYKIQHSRLPWTQMIEMRSRLIHAYFNVDEDILWNTLTVSIPALIPQLEQMLDDTAD